MKKTLFPALAAVFLLCGCSDNTNKVADSMCDCYKLSSVKFSSSTKKILGKVADSNDPKALYTSEIEKLNEDEKTKIAAEMTQASGLAGDAAITSCFTKVDETYKVRGTDQKSALKKVMEHMRSKGGDCEAWAGLMKLGLQAQEAPAGK